MFLRYLFAVVFALSCTTARAQVNGPGDPTISVITLGPGRMIYERYGHVAIRIQAPIYNLDVAYDWGNFDFNAPGFIGRFVKGDMRYWMEGKDGQALLDHYIKLEDRTVTIRELNLDHDQTYKLVDLIRKQDDEQHRYYLYDYFKDNCSTRVRDTINEAAGGALETTKQNLTPHDYRWHNRRLLRVGLDNVALMTGMELVTGPRLDVPLSAWDACYLPTLLGETLDRTTLPDGRPLVRNKRIVNVTSTPGNFEPTEAINPVRWTLPIGLICGGVLLLLVRVWPTGFRAGATLWELFVLVGAIFLPSVVLFTRHWVTAWDENFLQLTPLAIPILWRLWQRESMRPTLDYFSAAALGLSLIGAAITISHLTPQHNAPALCLALPLHAAVFLGIRRLRKGSPDVSTDVSSDRSNSEVVPSGFAPA